MKKFNRRNFIKSGILSTVPIFSRTDSKSSNTINTDDINPINGILNIKLFGAKGKNTDDTLAFKRALDYLHSGNGGSLYIPSGNYLIDPETLILLKPCKIFGDGKSSKITPTNINAAKKNINGVCFEIKSNSCIIEDLEINNFSVAIKWDEKQQININRCHLYQNRIGILCKNAYINTISNNYLTFNSVGIVAISQSFQLLIINNVIDNNISYQKKGGVGILLSGSTGCEVRSNTIEGNRNLENGIGCGIYITGVCSSLNIIGNWFEVNYEKEKINTKYAVDIYCSNDIKAENDSFQTNLINALFHKELIDVAKGTAYGSINIRDNCHVKTPHGIIFSYFNYGRISISGETFTGDSSFNNKPILIRSSGNNYYNTVINVSDIREQNTSGNTSITNKRMTSGKDGKLLFMDDNFSHTGILEINYN